VAHVAGHESVAFLPAVAAVAIFAQLLTAFLLFNQYRASGYPPLAVLALAYVGSAVLAGEWVLMIPHVWSVAAALGVGPQTSAWMFVASHTFFVTYVILYIFWESLCRRFTVFARRNGLPTLTAIAILLAIALPFALTQLQDSLPPTVDGANWSGFLLTTITPLLLAYYALAYGLLMFVSRTRTVVHLWLSVVIIVSFYEILVSNVFGSSRFSVGWYLGRAEWLGAASLFLLVLLGSVYRILLSLASHNATLYAQSVSDELTGLLNRRGFNARLEEELRRTQRKGENLTLLMIDIDDFKSYNDAFGHPAGDTALSTVARVIRTTLRRAADCGSRIGGEEFAILLPETDEPGALAVAERIRRGVERLGIVQGAGTHHPVLTVSVGIASTRIQPVADGLDLLRCADRVLYEAKSSGRNCIRFQGASHMLAGESSLAG
jgi:diguanylate cyclase (GGDEF)-like protein